MLLPAEPSLQPLAFILCLVERTLKNIYVHPLNIKVILKGTSEQETEESRKSGSGRVLSGRASVFRNEIFFIL